MKAYNIIFLLGSTITLIGAILLVLIDRLERGGPGLLILLLGMIIATYGLVLRIFSQIFKKDSMYVLLSAHQPIHLCRSAKLLPVLFKLIAQ